MDKPTGLEHLPIDTVECIASYLSERDLSQCCAVCTLWHQIFSNNILWRKRCNKNVDHNYLADSKCHVEPSFFVPQEVNSSLTPVSGSRLNYLQEQHLWRNWRCGQIKKEEIEFDCDDSIRYNIKVEWFNNDHVLLHTTFQTEVWDVSQTPSQIMTIPFYLKEMWEDNYYKVVDQSLVVVQCNVVQVFSICLAEKSWSFSFAFFFDQPEEFSSKITEKTDINALFQEISFGSVDDIERVVCGNFLVGILTDEESLKEPVMHIWNIKTGKKVKEQKCPHFTQISDIGIKLDDKLNDTIIVTFNIGNTSKIGDSCSFPYSLSKFEFINKNKLFHFGDSLLHDSYWCIVKDSSLQIVNFHFDTKFDLQRPVCLKIVGDSFIVSSSREVSLIKPSNGVMEHLFNVDFTICDFEVIHDKFIILHDMEYNVREIWQLGKPSMKALTFPEYDCGIFRGVNKACTKIVLEHFNKLFIIHFW